MKFTLPPAEFTFAGFSFPKWLWSMPRRPKSTVTGPYYHAPKPSQTGIGGYTLPMRWQLEEEWLRDMDNCESEARDEQH